MTSRIYIPTESPSDWHHLLAKAGHWKKGYSAMSTAASWEAAAGDFPSEIRQALEFSELEQLRGLHLLAAMPEWETPLEGGETPTHTDVMALASNAAGLCVIGVEAKANEDFGPQVGARFPEGVGHPRLRFLAEVLELRDFDISGLRYQLLHRTAACLITAQQFHARVAVMLVHSFGKRDQLRSDFEAFATALRSNPVGGLQVAPRSAGPMLILGWVNGSEVARNTELPAHPRYRFSMSGS